MARLYNPYHVFVLMSWLRDLQNVDHMSPIADSQEELVDAEDANEVQERNPESVVSSQDDVQQHARPGANEQGKSSPEPGACTWRFVKESAFTAARR